MFRRASETVEAADEPASRSSSPGKPPSSKAKAAQVVTITEGATSTPPVDAKGNAEPFRDLPTRPIPKEALPPPSSGRSSSPAGQPANKPSVDVKTAASSLPDNVIPLKVPPRAATTEQAAQAEPEKKAAGSPMPKILAAVVAVAVLGAAIFFLRGKPAEEASAPPLPVETAAETAPAPPALPDPATSPAPPPSAMEATAPPESSDQSTDTPGDKKKKKKKKGGAGQTTAGQTAETKPAPGGQTSTPQPATSGSAPAFTFTFQ